MKERYLDLMQVVIDAYPAERVAERRTMDGGYLTLQPYSRLTNVLACLVAAGRAVDRFEECAAMITTCCREVAEMERDVAADFAVKEIMMAVGAVTGMVSDDLRQRWLADLATVEPDRTYRYVRRDDDSDPELHNINVYNMVGEYLRSAEGLTDVDSYFAAHWPAQLRRFDEHGMYRDPGCPVLYDLTTRCQIQVMLERGYDGVFAGDLDGNLQRAGLMTLALQSTTGELPFGGRSNQYLFNEVLIAATCEFEAVRYRNEGDLALAGRFKRAARLAIDSIQRWVEPDPPRHIKNFFPPGSGHGTEKYGSFDSYLATLGAFAVIAHRSADDSIVELPAEADSGARLTCTSPSFHRIVARAGEYTIEIDTGAEAAYDATGLGRFHRAGAPTELALSVPLSGGNGYQLAADPAGLERTWAAIGPCWTGPDGRLRSLAANTEDTGVVATVTDRTESLSAVGLSIRYGGAAESAGCRAVDERYDLDADGLRMTMRLVDPATDRIGLRVPVLDTNGRDRADVIVTGGTIAVELGGFRYVVVVADGQARLDADRYYGNRNGVYRLATIWADGPELTATLLIEPVR